jgi:hypothetical protein
VKLKNGEPDMKFITIGGVAAAALALGTVAAFAQATDSPSLTFKPPPAGYNNSTVGPASSNQSDSTQYTQGTKPPPAGYNDSTIGPAGSSKSQSGQYTQGNSQSLIPPGAESQVEQTAPTPSKSQ